MEPRIKTLTSYRAVHTDGLEEDYIRSKEYLYQRSVYDDKGQLVSEETFSQDGSLEHRSDFAYNETGQMVEEILVEEGDMVSEHRTMEYDSQGRISKEFQHYLDESFDVTEYTYNSEGQLISKISQDSEGEEGGRVLYEYSGKNLVAETEYDSENEVIASKKYEFDDSGHLLGEIIQSPEGETETSYEYDEKGNRIVFKRYDANGNLVERHTFSRDDNGVLTGIREESVSGVELVELEYDQHGNLLTQNTHKESGDLISRINRAYDATNLLLTTQVYIEGSGQRLSQDYRLRFEYVLFT
jgi:YD repeat-containing protein